MHSFIKIIFLIKLTKNCDKCYNNAVPEIAKYKQIQNDNTEIKAIKTLQFLLYDKLILLTIFF